MKTFKLLNCHPKKTRKNNSCYDDKTLLMLKTLWNQKNNEKIKSTIPSEIWIELKKNITNCDHEICWLDKTLTETDTIKKIKKENFVPVAPVEEWKKYNNWLSSTEFNRVMEQYVETYPNFLYLGPSPIDFDTIKDGACVWPTLCNLSIENEMKRGINKIGIVLNLDKSSGGGSHWVAIFIDLKRKFIFYFESTGSAEPVEIHNFIKRISEQCSKLKLKMKLINNIKIKHQYGTSECGMYALFFIISLLTGKHSIQYFLKGRIKDSEVEQFRNIYFNKL